MPEATLRLDIPEGVWIGSITREFPEATLRILAATSDETVGVALAEIRGPDPIAVVEAMEAAEEVTSLERIQHSESTAIVQFETTMPLLLAPARDSGAPPELPVDIADGQAIWEVTAPHDRLSQLGDQLDGFGISFTVESIRPRVTDDQLLTDAQRDLVELAVELGYYDTPRRTSLTDLARAADIAKSTASETLHRAEETIIKEFVERTRDVTEPVTAE